MDTFAMVKLILGLLNILRVQVFIKVTTHLPVPFHLEFSVYIFQPSPRGFSTVWVAKNGTNIPVAARASTRKKQSSGPRSNLTCFETLPEPESPKSFSTLLLNRPFQPRSLRKCRLSI